MSTMAFGALQIAFDEHVLRPRPWTLAQSQWAQQLLAAAPTGPVLELCCGAGQIGLAAVAGTTRSLVCVDLEATAVAFCRANAAAAGLTDRVEVRHGAMDEVVGAEERFALVIADPPWVPSTQTARFPEDPLLAIDGGDDGLAVARTCLQVVGTHLAPGGSAVLQVGTEAQLDLLDLPAGEAGLALLERRVLDGGVLGRFGLPGSG
ncbi:class I SAM-dependent methyltransferase [Nocardioides mangrovicus]|uniref:Class I SAM-dependent methyltransferase n=1 Tax=Nocardioides mangrovicus TaxID=2478913 RepID=A0A3L8P251_9ACTN|nr:class I SAM-dependent methyltransferase [Nocardioides mangrovicus]RLV49047.1 class I SAM-dependent methyltransferase [Nocardioides mangrovicus]